eukprot:CAMPEP_0115004928 /NCGR_PEP_ID=MMETSP0216-20121206/19549_1 /TAXON_ID=223996 /ORGANISM="Protocruzia adherens, Strain Boccale" /LENGTH=935 /DNA_ID=CAMNT_0002371119 /DNA_START=97 /DNA_END=2905 /DNA_ORIENTATION=-
MPRSDSDNSSSRSVDYRRRRRRSPSSSRSSPSNSSKSSISKSPESNTSSSVSSQDSRQRRRNTDKTSRKHHDRGQNSRQKDDKRRSEEKKHTQSDRREGGEKTDLTGKSSDKMDMSDDRRGSRRGYRSRSRSYERYGDRRRRDDDRLDRRGAGSRYGRRYGDRENDGKTYKGRGFEYRRDRRYDGGRDERDRKDTVVKKDDVKEEGEVKKDEEVKDKPEEEKKKDETLAKPTNPIGRAGGVYIPPHKLAKMQEEIIKKSGKETVEFQRMEWEMLRKSINGIINKVNIGNIKHIIMEIFKENLVRGKGLFSRGVLKAQLAAPNFTHVYAAFAAVINTKLPEVIELLIKRVIIQFKRSYKRNDKIVCMSVTKMVAHLVNQKVVHELLALEILALLLEKPTDDSIEIACDFMTECGQVLADLTPVGVNAIFERFRGILHEGEIDTRVQYNIENLLTVRKSEFKDHPGVIEDLDLVEEDDQITHEISLDSDVKGEDNLNFFKHDPEFEQHEKEWDEIKKEILGEDSDDENDDDDGDDEDDDEDSDDSDEEEDDDKNREKIVDLTEQDLIDMKKDIYLVIQSSLDHNDCCHKLLKMNFPEGQEMEICNMILESGMRSTTYLRFYGLVCERMSQLVPTYKESFEKLFVKHYLKIHRYETNRIRNIAKLYGHLLYSDAIDWTVLQCVRLTQEDTTSSSRIFVKIVFQEMAENLGLKKLHERFQDPEDQHCFVGVFPQDTLKNMMFSINFFISIGLGALTDEATKRFEMRVEEEERMRVQEAIKEAEIKALDGSDSSDSSSSESSSDSSSSSGSSEDSDSDGSDSNSSESEHEDEKNKDHERESNGQVIGAALQMSEERMTATTVVGQGQEVVLGEKIDTGGEDGNARTVHQIIVAAEWKMSTEVDAIVPKTREMTDTGIIAEEEMIIMIVKIVAVEEVAVET